MIKKLFSITIAASIWTGGVSAALGSVDFTYNDPAKTRIVTNGNTVSITQGEESLSFTLGTGKVFANNGESVEEYEGLATDGNPARSWAIAFFDPEAVSPLHLHKNGIEDYFIFQGTGTVRRGDEILDVSPGVYVNIPTHTAHTVTNFKDNGQLVLAVKCAPSWVFEDFHFVTE